MNRRIYRVILVVTALTLVGFGIPLAVVVRQLNHDEVVVRLENEATRAALSVPTTVTRGRADVDLPEIDPRHSLGVYDRSGIRRYGKGPVHADRVVSSAFGGQPSRGTIDGQLIVAIPVISNQRVHAVVRAATPVSQLDERVERSWLLMAVLAAVILIAAAAAARLEARRLSKPVERLAVAMGRLGGGDFSVRTDRTGVPELDDAAHALDATAQRLGTLIERERSFSANASHQLRTPLTGIRLQLENALQTPGSDNRVQIMDALDAVDRLETTISDLLAITRQQTLDRDTVDLAELIDRQKASWQLIASSSGRELATDIEPDLPEIEVSEAAVRQILEVLVSNAFVHGAGTVTVGAGRRVGGVAIDVSDEGPGISGSTDEVFSATGSTLAAAASWPRDGTDRHGIGLPLARSLAESAGGRLLLRNTGPNPRFTLLLLAPDDS